MFFIDVLPTNDMFDGKYGGTCSPGATTTGDKPTTTGNALDYAY